MRKITLLIALFLLGIMGAYAQASSYGFSVSTGSYTSITGGTQITSSTNYTPTLDSYVSSQITLPAAFTFAGVSYTTGYVTSNGQLSLGSTAPNTYTYNILTTSFGNNAILAPFSADLAAGSTGLAEMRTELVGSEIVFQWTNFRRYNRAESFDFQIRLNTADNSVKYVYNGTAPFDTSTSYWPQVGIKSAVGDYKALVSANNGTWAAPTVITSGASSTSTLTFAGTSGFTSGLTYTFTAPVACNGAPLGGTISGDVVRFACTGSVPAAITVPAENSLTGLAYQWQESTDGTGWRDVTTGTGGTTLSFTPVAYAGTSIQYRLKTTCTATNDVVYSTNTVTVNPLTTPTTQVSALAAVAGVNQFTLSWTNGNGARRLVYVSTSAITDPVNGNYPAYTASATFANNGQQLVYDGTGSTVTVTGLSCNARVYVKVYEYSRCGSGPYDVYINTTEGTNTATVTTGPFSASLPVTNTFTGFTGANLLTAIPGWYEASIATTGGTAPTAVNPVQGTSNWTSSTVFGTTTAKYNLFTNTANAWIVSPKVTLTSNSRVKFKAALTDYNSGNADATAMQGTDDKVTVLISTDGCGAVWTPIYTFNAENTTTLSNTLVDFVLPLSQYTGQTVQIAFQATDGPVTSGPDYDFHIGNVVIESLPSCDVPLSVVSDNTGFTTAVINWSAPATTAPANGYQYYYSTTNTAPTEATTAAGSVGAGVLTANLTQLTANTTYYVWVRSACDDTTRSAWVAGGSFYTGYCTPAPTSVDGTGITRVVLGTINNATGAETGNYGNYASLSTTADVGTNVNFAITYSTGYTYGTKIWVDWNNDAVFDEVTELVYTGLSSSNSPTTLSGSFAIPADAALTGSHTVRIGGTDNDAGGTPCYNGSYGTYEDYTLVVNMPAVPAITSFTPDSACAAEATLTIAGTALANATVKVGETTVQTTSVTDTQIVATVPAGVSGVVSVTTVAGTATTTQQFVVTTPAAFILSAEEIAICNGINSEVVTISEGLTNYDTFVWSPATGFTGNPTDGYVFTPEQTTTYTLTASQSNGACVAVATLTVTVNPLPSALFIDPQSSTICEGSIQALTTTGGANTGVAVIGDGTTAPGSTAYPNPFSAYYGGTKTQILFTAAELQALGFTPGTSISTLSFDFFASAANALNDFRIKMGATTNTDATNGFVDSSALTTVYNANFTPTAGTTGWVPFTLTTPYVWNGGNLIVEIAHNAGNYGNGSGTRTRTTTTNESMVYYGATDNVTPAGMASYDALTDYTNEGASTSRPNISFSFSAPQTVTWLPVTGLYTDAAATVPYVQGASASMVYAMPTTTTTYVATVTNAYGCSNGVSTVVNVTSTDAPVATAQQTFCQGATVAQLMATGDNVQWYSDNQGGAPLASTDVLVSGTYYASQTQNGCESVLRAEVAVTISVVTVDELDDVTSCNGYELPELTAGNYYTAAGGNGTMLAAGDIVTINRTIYIFAQSGDCTAESSFEVTITTVDAPAAAAEQSFCSGAMVNQLSYNGDNVLWYASATATEPLSATEVLVNGGVYYASQTVNGCTSAERTAVTVSITTVTAPEVSDVVSCDSYVLPELAEGTYHTEANGSGDVVAAGTVITFDTTLYVYVQSGDCSAESSFDITINTTPVITAESPQVVTTQADVAVIEDIVVTANGDVVWYASESDYLAGTPIAAGTPIVAGTTYYATQTNGTCFTIVPVTVSEVLGDKSLDLAKFSYYPNPVTSELTISYSTEITSVTVFNMLGQQVISITPNAVATKVDMSGLSEAPYVVTVTAGSVSKTIKVVKK